MKNLINIHTHQQSNIAEIEVFNMTIGKDELPESLFTCGIHPWYIENPEEQISDLRAIAKNKNCIAIGECGLDKLKGAEETLQEVTFIRQIRFAKEVNKPLIIHCVKKQEIVAEILILEKFDDYFLLHGYNANQETISYFNKLPKALFSFGAALLKPGSNAERIFTELNLENCFLETDDSPESIENIYIRAAEIKGIGMEKLTQQIQHNFKRIFIDGR